MNHREFFIEYYREIPNHKRYEDAYNAVEEMHIKRFGRKKYSSYVVFRATLSRFNRFDRL